MAKRTPPPVKTGTRTRTTSKPPIPRAPEAERATEPTASDVRAPRDSILVRMYRQGLGDCFLLQFPRKGGGTPFTILIDCGIIPGTPNGDKRMRQVVDDLAKHLKETAGGRIDVLVATHEHADHLSGFNLLTAPEHPDEDSGSKQTKRLFDQIEVDQVWLAWTEDPADKVAASIRAQRRKKLAALWLGFHQLVQHLGAMGADAASLRDVEAASEVLSFFGIDPKTPPPPGGFGAAEDALAAAAKDGDAGSTAAAMAWAQTKGKKPPRFWEPGEVASLEGVEGVRVYVLGPPKDLAQLHKDLPSSSKTQPKETYEEGDDGAKGQTALARGVAMELAGAGVAERAFFASAFGAEEAKDRDIKTEVNKALPFDKKYRIGWDAAQELEFFQDLYFDDDHEKGWRRIDGEWAAGAAAFAMQLDGDTNNTSLALAFELPGGHVLLFPGDAQVGNWESWHADSSGKPLEFRDGATTLRATAESLLNRVVLYKVGHHGSHNATLRAQGLEMMPDGALAALVPVDAYVAHDKKRWTKMPFNPLMDRLAEKTKDGGLVVRADQGVGGGKTLKGDGVVVTIRDADEEFADEAGEFDVEGESAKARRPLYVDCLIERR